MEFFKFKSSIRYIGYQAYGNESFIWISKRYLSWKSTLYDNSELKETNLIQEIPSHSRFLICIFWNRGCFCDLKSLSWYSNIQMKKPNICCTFLYSLRFISIFFRISLGAISKYSYLYKHFKGAGNGGTLGFECLVKYFSTRLILKSTHFRKVLKFFLFI